MEGSDLHTGCVGCANCVELGLTHSNALRKQLRGMDRAFTSLPLGILHSLGLVTTMWGAAEQHRPPTASDDWPICIRWEASDSTSAPPHWLCVLF